jgi:hypothetical protein
MTGRILAAIALATGAACCLSACESTQDKSAALEAQGQKVLSAKGLEIEKREISEDVRVLDSTVISDRNGTAVVVRLRNDSEQDLAAVPIAIDVKGRKGKSIFENDLPGLEAGLVGMPVLRGGATAYWVYDQVFATGRPTGVDVRVADGSPLPPGLPEVEVSEPKLEVDPVSGIQVGGTVTNRSGEEQRNVLLLAVARNGGRVVAAGRGLIDRLKTTEPAPYHIFFIGDPRGAEVTIEAMPLNPLKEA